MISHFAQFNLRKKFKKGQIQMMMKLIRPQVPNTWIGTLSKHERLLFILQVILDMTHFVMHCSKFLRVDRCTHFDPGVKK